MIKERIENTIRPIEKGQHFQEIALRKVEVTNLLLEKVLFELKGIRERLNYK